MPTPPPRAAPRVSVVIPAFNSGHLLDRTLESVRAQTLVDWELVLVDDGSTDSTAEVAEAHAAVDPRIRVLRGQNVGVADARNRGLAAIDPRSEFVILLDHDDRWMPDTLEVLVAELDERPALVSVHGLARCIGLDDAPTEDDTLTTYMQNRAELRGRRIVTISPDEPTTFGGMVLRNDPVTPGLHLVRHEVLKRVGGFDANAVPADDWDMAIRISRHGPIGHLDRLVLDWRRHPDTLSDHSKRWRHAYHYVRTKAYADQDNTREQLGLLRWSFITSATTAFRQAVSRLRERDVRAAARAAANGVEITIRFGAAAIQRRARTRRLGTGPSR